MRYLTIFFLCITVIGYGQTDTERKTAPSASAFGVPADIRGSVSSSVNLSSGDVLFPVNLLSIESRNGLGIDVSITYNSNIQSQVDKWNLEAPTGVLALGWSLDLPKIIADTKQTGTREDDTFYLLENGGSNKLIRMNSGTDSKGAYYSYATKNYQFWQIKYYYDAFEVTGTTGSGPNRWEIVRDNGFTFVYGDKSSGRKTVQYAVRWGNWMGNSAQTIGQSQLAVAWNLSEIVNLRGEKITYEYDQVEQFVGNTSGLKHTEASYIKKISDQLGRRVEFFYKKASGEFYAEPHTEQPEPDAYQENYETQFLEHLEAYDETSTKYQSVYLRYDDINTRTNTAKRLLVAIDKRNYLDHGLKSIQYDYIQSGATKGFLSKVTYPAGGYVVYQYGSNYTVGQSPRNFHINAPAGYSEPKVWLGPDYVVVAWREYTGSAHVSTAKNVKLYVYTWTGKWREQYLQIIGGVSLKGQMLPPVGGEWMDYDKFQVVAQDGFFALLTPGSGSISTVWAYMKDEAAGKGVWGEKIRTDIDFGAGTPALFAGDEFFGVGSFLDDATHPSHLYFKQGDSFNDYAFDQVQGDHFYTATNNYLISHNRSDINGVCNINFNYLTADKKWTTVPWITSLEFPSTQRSFWYTSNSLAMVMASDNPEAVYRWDLTYTNFFKDTQDNLNNTLFGGLVDATPVSLNANSLIGINGRIVRFDGKNWYGINITSSQNGWANYFSYGDDIVVRPMQNPAGSGYVGARRVFNPNTLAWQSDFTMTGADANRDYSHIGVDYYYFGYAYYYRQPDGTWLKNRTVSDNRFAAVPMLPRADIWRTSGNVTLATSIEKGDMSTDISFPGNLPALYSPGVYFPSLGIGQSTVVTSGIGSNFDAASMLELQRYVNNNLFGNQLDCPVTSITVYDGLNNIAYNTAIAYTSNTATMDPAGTTARYNEVTVRDYGASTPFGKTVYHFHNGLTNTEMSVPYFGTNEEKWLGMPYEVIQYNKAGTEVSRTSTGYTTYPTAINNSNNVKVDVAYYVRPTSTSTITDGVTTNTIMSYNSNSGQISYQIADVSPSNGKPIKNSIVYWWEKYDPTRARNILDAVVQTTEEANSVPRKSQVTRWKNWTASINGSTEPGAVDSYIWLGTGAAPSSFSSWDASVAFSSPDWKYAGKVENKTGDNGAVYESVDGSDIYTSTIWDQYYLRPLAIAKNARFTNVAYTGFEDNVTGNWALNDGTVTTAASKTGSKHLNLGTLGMTKGSLTAASKYLISFWAKSSGGSVIIDGAGTISLGTLTDWTLFQYTVTSLTSCTIKKVSGSADVFIDDVRLIPSNASISTFTYHPFFGQTSTMDGNHRVAFTEYDEWGRVKNQLDENKSIIKSTTYTIKN